MTTSSPGTPVMTPCEVVDTMTPWGRDAFDLCVLRGISTQASVSTADLEAGVGGTNVQVRSSLGRLIARSAVTRKKKRYSTVEGGEHTIARKVSLWERPGGQLLRLVYTPWKSSLQPRQTGLLDGLIDRRLQFFVERLENWIKGPIDTKTAAGKELIERRLLRALTIRPGATVQELHPFTGGLYVQARASLHRLVETRRVVWRSGGYWIAAKGEELGYVGIEGPRGREAFDRLVLEAVRSMPKGATDDDLWVRVPGSRVRLRASVARLLHRKAIGWTMASGITLFFPAEESTP